MAEPGSTATNSLATVAKSLHTYMRKHLGVSDTKIDRGTPLRIWAKPGADGLSIGPPRLEIRGANDGVSTLERLQETFAQLEQIRFGTKSFTQEICPGRTNHEKFYCDAQKKFGFLPALLLDDGDSKTPKDAELRAHIDAIVAHQESGLIAQGLKRGAKAFNSALLSTLLLSTRRARAKNGQGGLGVQYKFKKDYSHWRRDGIEAYQAQEGDCNSHAFLFYGLAKRAGLGPVFIRVVGERNRITKQMTESFHIGVAVRLDPAKPDALTPVDPSRGLFLTSGDHQWHPLSPLEMTALHLRNVAYHNVPSKLTPEQRLKWQEARLKQAEALAPNNVEVLKHIGNFYLTFRDDESAALPYALRAQERNPSLRSMWRPRVSIRMRPD